ncbi:methyltransferase domain-containing protein [Hymenobacter sp. 15J16-1T3B]|uniref:class I SAM-dependent methyltransferase n=1 Tax=Hymenobacter sp. 15J16-1T3B TaxID=2886941 RepID=UPI001D12DB0F|nr:class I SAM-dependent methyltransferase [Hymenobacter sp. 15J16-1T3B]MCC3160064.1 methyltransferase domain-containing protein [Hymenobacter sp. 15J16-1T3B]
MASLPATIAAFDAQAEAYQAYFMDLDLYDDTYERLCQLLEPVGARVLELGCGPGNVTRALLRRRPDLHLEATDLAPNMVRLAQANNPTAHCCVLDCRDLSTLKGPYQAVVAGFCLPYLAPADATQLLRDAHGLLAPGGLVYLSFIDDVPARSGYEASSNGQYRTFVHYHPAATIRAELAAAGFAVFEEFRKPYPRAGGQVDTHSIVLARKL